MIKGKPFMKNKDRFDNLEKCELYFYKEIVRNIDTILEFEEWAELEIEDIKSLFENSNFILFILSHKCSILFTCFK